MKTLILLRHAKSSWKATGADDHDRPLKKRGLRDAPRAGQVVRERIGVPSVIVTSPALRAKTTAELVATAMAFQGDITADRRLYLASADQLLEVVRELPDEAERVLIVGHNPGLEEFVAAMVGDAAPMATAAIAALQLDIDAWSDASFDRGATLLWRWQPKDDRSH